ncbi:MAG TPA: LysM peptidoglycan-binding domain-containing protein [Thermodesulfobacteriota bacterium]|jgi:membrane-bound lytic murein transglycosylase D|nr:LysM peptidoglycan-binding domain-containing protein [Thermodesulfobacteriota bacterium]
MFFRYLLILVLLVIPILGCASKSMSPFSGSVSFYDADKRAEFEGERPHGKFGLLSIDSLFAKEDDSGFFLFQPNSQTWRAYYYFFNLRKRILEDFPHIVPETESDIPVVLNDKVHGFLEYFQGSGRGFFSEWLSRSGKYIPMMKKILEAKGMPIDLVYLAMIESGFNVKAKSNKGAVGPWQFIPSTAKRYGLRIDSWVDERMDPEKSTIAAANYLHDLYDMFQSWELAAAGYNCGEEKVQAAIDRFKVYDFWEISEYTLPQETKDYVPKLMAALIIAKNPEKYGFTGIEYQEPESVERAYVPPQRSLGDIAGIIGVSEKRLRDLNPSLIRGSTPPGSSYEINVPSGYAKVVAAKQDELLALKMVAVSTVGNPVKHVVKRGESLGKIAARYGVSVSSIKGANSIRGSIVRPGQVLTIPRGGTVPRNRSVVSKGAGSTSSRSRRAGRDVVKYDVKRGDTLWEIASKYNVSVADIKNWNNLKSTKLDSGDRLTIYIK